MIRFPRRAIQSPAASFANSALSSPRTALVSRSSMAASWRSPANFNRLTRRLFSRYRFPIDEQTEPLLERKGGNIGLALLLLEGLRHSGEPERRETFLRWMCKHVWFFFALVFKRRVDGAGTPTDAHRCPRLS